MSDHEHTPPKSADLSDLGTPPTLPDTGRFRFSLNRHHLAAIVITGYLGLALCIKEFLTYIESTQGYDDARDEQAALIFAFIMAALCVRALVSIRKIYKPVRLPGPL